MDKYPLSTMRTWSIPTDQAESDGLAEIKRQGFADKALITRLCTKEELVTAEAAEARQKEMDKLISIPAWSTVPQPLKQVFAEHKSATISRTMLITSIKGIAVTGTIPKYKGRFVVTGNRIWGADSRAVQPHTESYWAPITSLEGIRAVICHAIGTNQSLSQADIEAAYLQTPWPEDRNPHYLILDDSAVACLSSEAQSRHREMNRPVYKMLRCLYGHPLSGKIFIETLLKELHKRNWRPSAADTAVLHREASMTANYVDDLVTSQVEGTDEWVDLVKRFPLRDNGPIDNPLGIAVTKARDGFNLDMSEYAAQVVKVYETERGPIHHSHFPIKLTSQELKSGDTRAERFVLRMIGMLNWLSRCARPDLAYACSTLASALTTWSETADQELSRVVGYVKRHGNYKMTMSLPRPTDTDNSPRLIAYADSSWVNGRGQVSVIAGFEQDDHLMPVAWVSRRHSATAASSVAAEFVAAAVGARILLHVHSFFLTNDPSHRNDKWFTGTPELRLDSTGTLAAIEKGTSSKTIEMQKSMGCRVGMLGDLAKEGHILYTWTSSESNLADQGTKPFTGPLMQKQREALSLQ